MAEWSAEVVVDEALVRRLLRTQFPQLRAASLGLLAEGWDNAVWVVDDEWAFRFPRRAIAIPGVRRELAVLPRLAPLLPLPIPAPVFAGRPSAEYPWPFFGARLLPGRESVDAALDDDRRARLAPALGTFLRELHGVDPAAVEEGTPLPFDPNRRTDMAIRVARARERIAEIGRLGLWRAPPAVERILSAVERLPPPQAVVLAHGDLHARHLLVGDDGALTGVIDWGDVCRADPAIDLMSYWSFLPPGARDAFLDAYGPVTDEQLLRARVLALFLSASLAAYAHDEGLTAVKREALAGLARTVVDAPS